MRKLYCQNHDSPLRTPSVFVATKVDEFSVLEKTIVNETEYFWEVEWQNRLGAEVREAIFKNNHDHFRTKIEVLNIILSRLDSKLDKLKRFIEEYTEIGTGIRNQISKLQEQGDKNV